MSEPTPAPVKPEEPVAPVTATPDVPVTATPDAPVDAQATATPITQGGKKSNKKTAKKNGGKSKKSRKMTGAAKDWVSFVTQVFKDGKAKNPSYKFKQALKDASKLKKKNKTAKK